MYVHTYWNFGNRDALRRKVVHLREITAEFVSISVNSAAWPETVRKLNMSEADRLVLFVALFLAESPHAFSYLFNWRPLSDLHNPEARGNN
jgi:hypothetical protein